MPPFGTWLAEIGLGRYDQVFAANEMDFDVTRSVAPYLHAKMAPRSEDGDADRDITIRITGGLPDE